MIYQVTRLMDMLIILAISLETTEDWELCMFAGLNIQYTVSI